ncbi:MAG: precorrin-3B C(17)-methyltransferase [Prochlorothrix sp.]|nr:precorrin-3B C(17)-methyltransferase [Prochlorothrix sp.]
MYCFYQDYLIRDWRPSDRQAVADLIGSVLAEYGLYWQPDNADRDILAVEDYYWAKGGEFWVVEQYGVVVGTGAYYPVESGQFGQFQGGAAIAGGDQSQPDRDDQQSHPFDRSTLNPPDRSVEMRKLYLLPQARGLGLGKWLVQQLERAIADRGYNTIWIETVSILKEATQLYANQGYLHQDTSQLVVERCDLLMAKQITPWRGYQGLPQTMAAITTTEGGIKTLARLCGDFRIPLWTSAKVLAALADRPPASPEAPPNPTPIAPSTPGNLSAPSLPPHLCHAYDPSLRETLGQIWANYEGFVFSLATGAVVRLIAPLLQDKATDPAVVVVDEAGQFVVSLCSGHQGGADRLAQGIAQLLGATPVLTGASAVQGLGAIDLLGQPFGWQRGAGDWTAVSAAFAQGLPIAVHQQAGSTLWRSVGQSAGQSAGRSPWSQLVPEDDSQSQDCAAEVWITTSSQVSSLKPFICWHPRVLWLGIGCERGTPAAVIEAAIAQTLSQYQLAPAAIAGVATLDLKGDEPGLLQVCGDRQWPLSCFTPEQLRSIPVPNPSAVVEREVGTPSVAEAAARRRAGYSADSPEKAALIVPKHLYRQPDQPGAVTVAIAQADRELIGKPGALALIGTGPGAISQITPAAQAALTGTDVVIGYGLYIDLVRPLLRSAQMIEALPITQERARAERAIELAQWGLKVAVISSGDSGIYGMAGLVLESLSRQGWDGQTPAVQVFPGITALQAAAAQVGTPLMHDFCAISLSDLLTPWPVIEKRLQAAAAADFVIALYNPQSKTRREPLIQAQKIFLQHRQPKTPVALVRSAYRPDQTLTLTTLGEFLTQDVDMLTTVLIGNASTYRHGDWLITPRGYLGQI